MNMKVSISQYLRCFFRRYDTQYSTKWLYSIRCSGIVESEIPMDFFPFFKSIERIWLILPPQISWILHHMNPPPGASHRRGIAQVSHFARQWPSLRSLFGRICTNIEEKDSSVSREPISTWPFCLIRSTCECEYLLYSSQFSRVPARFPLSWIDDTVLSAIPTSYVVSVISLRLPTPPFHPNVWPCLLLLPQ